MSVIKIGGGGDDGSDISIIQQIEQVLKQKYSLINISDVENGKPGYSIFENYDDMLLAQLQGISGKKTLIFIKDEDVEPVTHGDADRELKDVISLDKYAKLPPEEKRLYESEPNGTYQDRSYSSFTGHRLLTTIPPDILRKKISPNEYSVLSDNKKKLYEKVNVPSGMPGMGNTSDLYQLISSNGGGHRSGGGAGGKRRRTAKKSRSRRHRKTRK